jgi:hypothetical protein
MPRTQVSGSQLRDDDIGREDLNHDTVGRAVILRVIAGEGVTISSTGIDTGTGDVTINATGGSVNDAAQKLQIEVDFGYENEEGEGYTAETTIPANWITSSMCMVCSPASNSLNHDGEDIALEEIKSYVVNIIDGISFDVIAYSAIGTWGKYKINIIGLGT